jgi:hypothetical protein
VKQQGFDGRFQRAVQSTFGELNEMENGLLCTSDPTGALSSWTFGLRGLS